MNRSRADRRIISLLPAATEIVCALGLQDSLVGVSHQCDHPGSVLSIPKVTVTSIPSNATSRQIDQSVRQQLASTSSLFSLDVELFRRLDPDLVITQALCGVCAVSDTDVQRAVASLDRRPDVLRLEPHTLDDVFESIGSVGRATGAETEADELVRSLRERITRVVSGWRDRNERPTVLLLEWLDPPFSAGHWNPELIELAGGRSVVGEPGRRSETLSWETIAASDPDIIVVACCGYSIEQSLVDLQRVQDMSIWRSLRAVRHRRIHVLDGSQYFNRPGPRLVDSLEQLARRLDESRREGSILSCDR